MRLGTTGLGGSNDRMFVGNGKGGGGVELKPILPLNSSGVGDCTRIGLSFDTGGARSSCTAIKGRQIDTIIY